MTDSQNPYLAGGGEMGSLTRAFDWSKTVLGPSSNWSPSLLTTVGLLLKARYPMFLWWGKELIQFYNDAYRPSLGNKGKHPLALGQPGADCWPEIWPVIGPLIESIMNGADATWMEDALIPIYRNDQLEDVYWTFSYSHVYDGAGGPGGVLVVCAETTDKVAYRQQLEQSIAEMNNSEARLRYMLREAPLPIASLSGRNLVIESANKKILEIWGKTNAVIGQPLALALPELQGQHFLQLLDDVYTSGQPFYGNEMRALLEKDGVLEEVYTNFVYYPIKGVDNGTNSIMLVATIVTEQVLARKELERSRDTLKLAHAAAELGTFDLDLENTTMYWDERCRALFGISHTGPVSYEQDFVNGLHPDDRARVLEVIARSFDKHVSGGDYDTEYRTIDASGRQLRWVRAKGKVYFDAEDKPLRFAGAVLDITEAKLNELRKNDFIAMVSHELKTPLTALKGYVQLVQTLAEDQPGNAYASVMKKIDNQVNKMTNMINGFLNVAKLETGKIALQKKVFLLPELLKEIIEEVRIITHHTHFTLRNENPVSVTADYEKIGQVVSNLLNNAVKYSPRDAPIEIFYTAEDQLVTVAIRDAGTGIDPADREHIFERFYRGEESKNKQVSGFGIGLYLSSAIIEQHGGKIWAENNEGAGATFYFVLPAGA